MMDHINGTMVGNFIILLYLSLYLSLTHILKKTFFLSLYYLDYYSVRFVQHKKAFRCVSLLFHFSPYNI